MCNGTIVRKDYDANGYGYYIIMKDSSTGMGFLYAHLREPSPLNAGDSITVGQYVGHEGETGNASGIHLHLEMQDLTNHEWIFGAPKETYTNPTTFMGFPNQEGISVFYSGTPGPGPIPPITRNKKYWKYLTGNHLVINT